MKFKVIKYIYTKYKNEQTSVIISVYGIPGISFPFIAVFPFNRERALKERAVTLQKAKRPSQKIIRSAQVRL
jgi:hypothetical protein